MLRHWHRLCKTHFDTQIISNRKYSNPLFPLIMLWFWETETQWLKEQVGGSQYKWQTLISSNTVCSRMLMAGRHPQTQGTAKKHEVHGWGLGLQGFLPTFRGLGSKPAEMNGKIPSGSRPFWAGPFKGACYEYTSTHRWLQPVLGYGCCAQPAPCPLWSMQTYIYQCTHRRTFSNQNQGKENGILSAPRKTTVSSGQQNIKNSPI